MATVSNTSPGMQAAGRKFVETDQLIDGIAQNLRGQVEAMQWGGSAGPVFKQTMGEWNLAFAKIQHHLDVMAEMLLGQSVEILNKEDEARLQAAGFFNEGSA
jgi:uncharacterized protein YukE